MPLLTHDNTILALLCATLTLLNTVLRLRYASFTH
jgi:hypothetical protein